MTVDNPNPGTTVDLTSPEDKVKQEEEKKKEDEKKKEPRFAKVQIPKGFTYHDIAEIKGGGKDKYAVLVIDEKEHIETVLKVRRRSDAVEFLAEKFGD